MKPGKPFTDSGRPLEELEGEDLLEVLTAMINRLARFEKKVKPPRYTEEQRTHILSAAAHLIEFASPMYEARRKELRKGKKRASDQ